MIVSRVVVSLRIPGLEKKSLMKIASPVYKSTCTSPYHKQAGSCAAALSCSYTVHVHVQHLLRIILVIVKNFF